ncbi:MAG: hypothetical protein JW703_01325 [Candidatus Diapherotrites archaeon]|nr:hypothetical protein [Candidatus Diapherotrites archaeon]
MVNAKRNKVRKEGTQTGQAIAQNYLRTKGITATGRKLPQKMAELIKQTQRLARLEKLKKTNPEKFKQIQQRYKRMKANREAQEEIKRIKREQGIQTAEPLKKFYPSLEKEIVIEPEAIRKTTKPEIKIVKVEDFISRNIGLNANPQSDVRVLYNHAEEINKWLSRKKIFVEEPKIAETASHEVMLYFGLKKGNQRGQFEIKQIRNPNDGWYWRETLQMPESTTTVFRDSKGKIIPKPERKLRTF